MENLGKNFKYIFLHFIFQKLKKRVRYTMRLALLNEIKS